VKYPLGILEDIPIKVGDFMCLWILLFFTLLRIPAPKSLLVGLSRQLWDVKIDVKKDRQTFDVGEHHVEFVLFKDHNSSVSCCGCDAILSNNPMELIDVSPNNPQHFAYECFERKGLNSVKVNLVEHLPPNIVQDKPYAFEDIYLSNCYRFAQLMIYMPSDGVDIELI